MEAFIAAGGKYQPSAILPTGLENGMRVVSFCPMAPDSRPTLMCLPADHGSAGYSLRQSVI